MKLVLLAEDEYGNAEILRLLLEAEGFRVSSASNGKLALELLAGEKPALILTDFMMPHATGGEPARPCVRTRCWKTSPSS
ncbi:response regulator [Rhizobacter sp. J219]|uniref:response regulator n=1 Tax=Rhizobacter sp. J219 TaxID=2898430 RepID=UPI002151C6EB|nr:response regulator [Rhizobacter sp. J219]MCR5885067.1 response regulator [Rhizobacter sp. J219]